MAAEADAIRVIDDWYGDLDLYRDNLPSKGSLAAALVVLERLQSEYKLDISDHVSGKQAQIAGLSSNSVRKILEGFGEKRRLSAMGGRSNRGARGDVAKLLDLMRPLNLNKRRKAERVAVLRVMQGHLVTQYVGRHFAVKRVKATYDQNFATWQFIHTILENAKPSGKAGAVAEYLVGAKLALRFPDKDIRNKQFSTSDAQAGLSADFEIGNTALHVTVAPMPELLEKCKANLERGLRVYLLVLDSQVVGTRQTMELIAADRIAVESIESLVATNIDELAEFDGNRLKSGFRRLLDTYNVRVDAVELDKSLLIDIPPNLE